MLILQGEGREHPLGREPGAGGHELGADREAQDDQQPEREAASHRQPFQGKKEEDPIKR
jgi:hypothetical protein